MGCRLMILYESAEKFETSVVIKRIIIGFSQLSVRLCGVFLRKIGLRGME